MQNMGLFCSQSQSHLEKNMSEENNDLTVEAPWEAVREHKCKYCGCIEYIKDIYIPPGAF